MTTNIYRAIFSKYCSLTVLSFERFHISLSRGCSLCNSPCMNETLRGKACKFPMMLCEELSNLLCSIRIFNIALAVHLCNVHEYISVCVIHSEPNYHFQKCPRNVIVLPHLNRLEYLFVEKVSKQEKICYSR